MPASVIPLWIICSDDKDSSHQKDPDFDTMIRGGADQSAHSSTETTPDHRRKFRSQVKNSHEVASDPVKLSSSTCVLKAPKAIGTITRCLPIPLPLECFDSYVAEHYPSRVCLETDEPRDAGRTRQTPIRMLCIATDEESELCYLDSVESDRVILPVNTDLVRVPLSQGPRGYLRRRCKSVDCPSLMQRVMELVGIRIVTCIINLDFEPEIHRHEMRVRVSFAIRIGEAHKDARIIIGPGG